MSQKIDFQAMPFTVCGPGRVDDTQPIDLMEYAFPDDQYKMKHVLVSIVPKELHVSKRIGKTVYDVTGCFDANVSKSLLSQFRDLILNGNMNDLQN